MAEAGIPPADILGWKFAGLWWPGTEPLLGDCQLRGRPGPSCMLQGRKAYGDTPPIVRAILKCGRGSGLHLNCMISRHQFEGSSRRTSMSYLTQNRWNFSLPLYLMEEEEEPIAA